MIRRAARQTLRILTLRCDDHRRLQAMRLDGTITLADRLAMWGHWIACGPCRAIVRQLTRVDDEAKRLEPDTPAKLSAEARTRIEARLSDHSGSSVDG